MESQPSDAYSFVFKMLIFIVFIVFIRNCMRMKRKPILYVWPLWGIGNRLRTVRICHNIACRLGHELIVIEHFDDGFDEPSLVKLLNLPFRSIHLSKFKHLSNVPLLEYNDQCTLKITTDELDKYKGKSFCIKACEINVQNDNSLNEDNSLYNHVKFNIRSEDAAALSTIFSGRNLVGVHIRQGNVNDWSRGYFFNEEWRNIREREPNSSPQFCCFKDSSKNLSACTSNVTSVELFVQRMKEFPPDTEFFVCADRTGCLLYLHQMFPNRIHMLPIAMQTDKVNTKMGLADFYGLTMCSSVIVSKVSSFADEARRVNNIPVIALNT